MHDDFAKRKLNTPPSLQPSKSIEQRMAERGISGPPDLDDTPEPCELWETDEEVEAFLFWLKESRRIDLEMERNRRPDDIRNHHNWVAEDGRD